MKLSKTVVDLECSRELSFQDEFARITKEDTEFADIMGFYENKLSQECFDCGKSYTDENGKEILLMRDIKVFEIFYKAYLNLYRIMSVQAEIDEVERECGTKED